MNMRIMKTNNEKTYLCLNLNMKNKKEKKHKILKTRTCSMQNKSVKNYLL
jgi:hypothetical protein